MLINLFHKSAYTWAKRKVYSLLDPSSQTPGERGIKQFIIILIILNTLAVILETVQEIYTPYQHFFRDFDLFSVGVFTIEYLLRIWSCTENERYEHPVKGRLKYIFSAGALIDLFAILPFYLPLLFIIDLRFIRILRLLRFFRFLKLTRYLKASKLIGRVVRSKKEELIISLVLTMILVVLASCVMYYTEHEVQPDKFSSIPNTMLWSISTITTLGNGDMYAISPLGKTLTAFISILGIGMFALPTGILASGFSEEFHKIKNHGKVCPHCGKDIE